MGVLTRTIISISRFHARFGHWPTRLTTSPAFWRVIDRKSEEEWGSNAIAKRLRIDLVNGPDQCLVVADELGHTYDYYSRVDEGDDEEPNRLSPSAVNAWLKSADDSTTT